MTAFNPNTQVLAVDAQLTVLKYEALEDDTRVARETLAERFTSTAPGAGSPVQTASTVDLTPRVSGITISEINQFTGGSANITLVMYAYEYARHALSTPPVNANNVRTTETNYLAFRHVVKLGEWIHVKRGRETVFLGVITGLSTRQHIGSTGEQHTLIQLTCANFMYLFQVSQFRMTPVGDKLSGAAQITDILTTIDTGAIAQYGDYRDGFLKTVQEAMKVAGGGISMSVFLQRVVAALGHYRLPAALGGGRLGENIIVLDGGKSSFAQFGISKLGTGNDADVIKATLLTKYRAALMTNMTHAEIINSIFMPLLPLLELYPVIIPARGTPLTGVERSGGFALALVYRFKPCTPLNGPSILSYGSAKQRQSITNPKSGGNSFCTAYFGDSVINGTYYQVVDRKHVAAMDFTLSDAEHFNAVFLDQGWSEGDTHNGNLIRANAPLLCDVNDVNTYGLRCYSASHPFWSHAQMTAQQRADYEISNRAIPERLFHTMAMGNEYYSGQITLFQTIGALRPGIWLQVSDLNAASKAPLNLTHEDSFLCYIVGVDTAVQVSNDGVAMDYQVITFVRGCYGVNIPIPHTLDGPPASVNNLRRKATSDWEF